jgi:hypothetical protein
MLDLQERIDRMLNWVEAKDEKDYPRGRWFDPCAPGVEDRKFSVEGFHRWYDLEEAIEAIAPGRSKLQPGMRRNMYDPEE